MKDFMKGFDTFKKECDEMSETLFMSMFTDAGIEFEREEESC